MSKNNFTNFNNFGVNKMEKELYNYRTGNYDYQAGEFKDWQSASDYVPQLGGVGLLRIYCEHYKMPVLDAMLRIFKTTLGEAVDDLPEVAE